ncbi:MAG: radical SAM protein [Desulfosarcina sp.]
MTHKSILLIHPPVTKPCEPPAGLAKLAGSLREHGVDCRILDASIDGLLHLLDRPAAASDTWTRRAWTRRTDHVQALRTMDLFGNRARYERAVMDLNRLLHTSALCFQTSLTLANYQSDRLSPVRSADLIQAAEQYEANPFFAAFSAQLGAVWHDWEPDVVGVSINFMSQALCAFAMIGFIRRQLPRTTVVCGGGLVSSWMRLPGRGSPFSGLIDDMVCGAGESRLIALCTGSDVPTDSVIGYDWDAFHRYRYLSPLRVMPYSTSRGCYWKKCAFCPETAEDAPYNTGPPRSISEDLKATGARMGAGLIHFLDNALSPRFLGYLIDHPPGIPWYGFARVTRHLTDAGFVHGLRVAGCVMLKLGVESGDQAVLDALAKGVDIGMVSRALKTIHQAGIATYVYLLFGTPAENEASANRTLAFTRDHAAHIDYLNLAVFNLPAHSRDAASLDTREFYAGDLSLYREFVHPQSWNRNRVRPWLSKVFRKQAAIRQILNNDPPYFTSNHAPFFSLAKRSYPKLMR